MNIFKKILLKNIEKEAPEKFVDDIGDLIGNVSIRGYRNNKVVYELDQKNSITNLSKTTLIRLLAGSSASSKFYANNNNTGFINTADFAISKMRFSNLPFTTVDGDPDHPFSTSNRKYLYYNIKEPSALAGFGLNVGGVNSVSGVPAQANAIISVSLPSVTLLSNVEGSTLLNNNLTNVGGANYAEFWNPNNYPPSLGTLQATINSLDTVAWNNKDAYTRKNTGNSYTSGTLSNVNMSAGYPKLAYFDDNNPSWRILHKSPVAGTYTTSVNYKIGQYNVINNIVPKVGKNLGAGSNFSARYGGSEDFYSLTSRSLKYSNSTFVDDIGATFSTVMNQDEGNGETGIASIDYGFLFLFTENDTLFSTIRLGTPFSKDDNTSFSINWTLSAPT